MVIEVAESCRSIGGCKGCGFCEVDGSEVRRAVRWEACGVAGKTLI